MFTFTKSPQTFQFHRKLFEEVAWRGTSYEVHGKPHRKRETDASMEENEKRHSWTFAQKETNFGRNASPENSLRCGLVSCLSSISSIVWPACSIKRFDDSTSVRTSNTVTYWLATSQKRRKYFSNHLYLWFIVTHSHKSFHHAPRALLSVLFTVEGFFIEPHTVIYNTVFRVKTFDNTSWPSRCQVAAS